MPRKLGIITTAERSRLMARVRQSGTSAELAVRRILNRLGVNYEVEACDLPGSPDIANRNGMWVIFVHGCFWHAHQGCKLWKTPKSNRSFWKKKFLDNRRRDREKTERLRELGHAVLVLWQCELKNEDSLENKLRGFLADAATWPNNGLSETAKSSEDLDAEEAATQDQVRISYSRSGEYATRRVNLGNGRIICNRIRANATGSNGVDPQSAFEYAFLRKRNHPVQRRRLELVRTADLFCGCGGLSLGAMEACRALGKLFVPTAAVDYDSTSLDVYESNFHFAKTFSKDIRTYLDGEIGSEVTSSERVFLRNVGKVDLLLAGPPCQGYSFLNNITRKEDWKNILYERVARFIEVGRPQHVLIENVPTVIHGVEKAVEKSIGVIKRSGYRVDSGIVDLAEIGVPQRRKRHVVVASLTKTPSVERVLEKNRVECERSIRWAIDDLEEANDGIFDKPSQQSEENMRRIEYLRKHDLYDLPDEMRPQCHRNGGHSYKSMYGRLKMDEPAQTITGGFGSPGQGRFIHPNRKRTLTPHEAARLQFFPDFFDFSSVESRVSLASMIGNAAPMELSYVFCLDLLT